MLHRLLAVGVAVFVAGGRASARPSEAAVMRGSKAVVFNTAYLDAWGVVADDQGTNGNSWDITPTARCIGP